MPFKEEDISNDPFIKLYHDVLYDNGIMRVKSNIANFVYLYFCLGTKCTV